MNWIERKAKKVKATALAFFYVVAINLKFVHKYGRKCNIFFWFAKQLKIIFQPQAPEAGIAAARLVGQAQMAGER